MEQTQSMSESELENWNSQSASVRNAGHEPPREGDRGEMAPGQQAMFVVVDHAHELRALVDRIGILLEVESRAGVSVPVSLEGVVAEAVARRRADATQKGLTLETKVDSGLPLVLGNPRHLSQALDCLIENACKFTPAGGRVQVQAYGEPGWACLAVRDTGSGIAKEKLSSLLDVGWTVDPTIHQRKEIGLGLTVAKSVVEAHGGRIEVESQPGQGSVFVIKLPARAAAPQPAQMDAGAARVRRILIVDDEENVGLILQGCLEKLPNCAVTVEVSGEQALRLFEQQPFDLLVTDYRMPDVDGMTLAERVRKLYPQTAIVMITAYGSEDVRERAARASIQRVLDKPVKFADIRSAALAALDQGVESGDKSAESGE